MLLKYSLIILLLIFATLSCENEIESNPPDSIKQVTAQGNIYNHCDIEPFYLLLDTVMTYTSPLPIDSLFSPNWLGYIDNAVNLMHDVYQDSTNADFKIKYLINSQLEYEILNPSLSIEPITLTFDTLNTDTYPFYGAIKIYRDDQEITLIVLNRYVGGCFHDEFIWQLSE